MGNYIYFQHDQGDLVERFSAERSDGYRIYGTELWQTYIRYLLEILEGNSPNSELRGRMLAELYDIYNAGNDGIEFQSFPTEQLVLTILLVKLRRFSKPDHPCPRLFVSHRQSDGLYALRVAQIAEQLDFAYWVDILDPLLRLMTYSKIPRQLGPLLTACVIEMAIINCTHLIACMTPQTRGSLWQPYEYGRKADIPHNSVKASAWLHPDLSSFDFPEYMLLGEVTRNETDVANWLKREIKLLQKEHCYPPDRHLHTFTFPQLPGSL